MRGSAHPALLLTLFLSLWSTVAPASVPQPTGQGLLEIELSPTEITVGDRIEARLTLIWSGPEPVTTPRFPTWQDHWGDAEVLATGDVEQLTSTGTQSIYRQVLTLTAFITGEIGLAEVQVAVPLSETTVEVAAGQEAGFRVRSILSDEPQSLEPRPPAPPRRLSSDTRFAWTAAGLGGLSLLIAWLLGARAQSVQRASRQVTPVEPLPALLEQLMRINPNQAEPAHTGLSLGLRTFLGRRLGFPATESTTTEIARRLRRAQVEAEAAERTVRLLQDCDQVKYARTPVAVSETRQRLRQARDLGYRIERALRPEPREDTPAPETANTKSTNMEAAR